MVEKIQVEQGFETALGAALGEDLDASLSGSAPVKWGPALEHDLDADLPEGVRALSDVVIAPGELARRPCARLASSRRPRDRLSATS